MSGWWERIPHDYRIVLLALLAAFPGIAISLAFLWMGPYSSGLQWTATVLLLGGWAGFTYALRARVVRPLQTLSNMLAALREGDFSIRVRGAGSRGALALTYMEANALEESIAGSLQNLTRRGSLPADLDADVESGLKVIAGRAESLGRFMVAYAQLARLPEPQLAAIEVSALVRRIVAIETRVEVGVRPGPDLTIQADADQLDQLLINLVRNAVDAALETTGGVELSWSVVGNQLHVLVADEGPGLPADTGNLFVPFYTTKPGGSGIGLALCRQIAEGHGGTLTLENSLDRKGARARLTIPLDLAPAEPLATLALPPEDGL